MQLYSTPIRPHLRGCGWVIYIKCWGLGGDNAPEGVVDVEPPVDGVLPGGGRLMCRLSQSSWSGVNGGGGGG